MGERQVTLLSEIRERMEASPSLAHHFTHYKKDVLALLDMIEEKDSKFRAIIEHQKEIGGAISVYSVTAKMAELGLGIGHGGEREKKATRRGERLRKEKNKKAPPASPRGG